MRRSTQQPLFLSFILCLFCYSSLLSLSASAPTLTADSYLLEQAQMLPQQGRLVEDDGFVYVKVDNRYIFNLFPLINEKGFQRPGYFRRQDSPGAHISVFYQDETERVGPIKEIGQVFHFTLEQPTIVKTHAKSYFILQVHSPELEQLRVKYGLKPLLKNHDFHITIGQQKHRKYNP